MIKINESLKFDTIKLVTKKNYLLSIDETLCKYDIDPSTGDIKSVEFNSQKNRKSIPFELYIYANHESGKMTIEFSSKLLLNDYPKLISQETLSQCLHNIKRIGVASLDVDSIIEDCCFTKLHIARDIDFELTPEILDRLNLCTGNYRRYKWNRYNDAILFYKDVKSADCKEAITVYNKGKEILLPKNSAFLKMVNDAKGIKEYFDGKTRFEVQLNNKRKIQKELGINDTSVKTVMGVNRNILLAQFDKIFTESAKSINANPDTLSINTLLEYGMLNTIRYYKGDLKKIEQEIKDMRIYGSGSRAAMGRQMKKIKEMAQAWSNQEMDVDDTIEQIKQLLRG